MLHDFLAKRDINRNGNKETLVINRNGNKETLVTNANNAFIMNIPVTKSDVQEEIEEIK